jgi:hypothetical protein
MTALRTILALVALSLVTGVIPANATCFSHCYTDRWGNTNCTYNCY